MAKGTEGNKVRTITCEGCGTTVTRRMPPGRRFCTVQCYRNGPRPGRMTGETRLCLRCGTEFYVTRHRIELGQGLFCSLACHNSAQGDGKTEHTCKTCGQTFRWSPSRSRSNNITYCTLTCRDADPHRRAMLLAMNERQQAGKVTRAEQAGYAMLDATGIAYERQVTFAGKFTPDAVVPSARLVVQFDGDYWHDRNSVSAEARILRRVALDRSQDAYVRACGWEVARFWESDLRADPAGCAVRLNQHLHRPVGDEPSRTPPARASSPAEAAACAA